MFKSQASDLSFGATGEHFVLPLINQFFNDQAVAYEEMYSTQDYHSCSKVYELKSRRIKHDAYSTAIIGCNKAVLNPADKGKDLYFLFNYTDGLYFIKYEPAIFATFNKRSFCRHSRSDYTDRASDVFDIPVERLTKIN
jgi:hypothetical protein